MAPAIAPMAAGGTGGGAQRAADALLEARVLEPVQPVAAAKTGEHRHLLLRVLDRDGTLGDAPEGGPQAAQRLTEGAPGRARRAGQGAAEDLDRMLVRPPGHVSA